MASSRSHSRNTWLWKIREGYEKRKKEEKRLGKSNSRNLSEAEKLSDPRGFPQTWDKRRIMLPIEVLFCQCFFFKKKFHIFSIHIPQLLIWSGKVWTMMRMIEFFLYARMFQGVQLCTVDTHGGKAPPPPPGRESGDNKGTQIWRLLIFPPQSLPKIIRTSLNG